MFGGLCRVWGRYSSEATQALTPVCTIEADLVERGERRHLRAHKHWTFGWRCILHIAQSACKWGLAPILSEDLQHNAHIVVKALTNSSDPFHRRIDEFVYSRVFFDFEGGDSEESTREFWTTLGVSDDKVLRLLLEVKPRWDNSMQCLRVDGALQGKPDSHDKIRSIVMFCLQWQNWSDTRWMKFNKSA